MMYETNAGKTALRGGFIVEESGHGALSLFHADVHKRDPILACHSLAVSQPKIEGLETLKQGIVTSLAITAMGFTRKPTCLSYSPKRRLFKASQEGESCIAVSTQFSSWP